MVKLRILGGALAALLAVSPSSEGTPIATRGELDILLGAGAIMEDFESLVVANNSAMGCLTDTLNVASLCNGQGPGLIVPDVTISAGPLQWNGQDYFGQLSKNVLGDGNSLTVDFTGASSAFGLDISVFEGFSANATVDVYGTDDVTLLGSVSGLLVNDPRSPVFFGWFDAGGIGLVTVTGSDQNGGGTPIIDNLTFGAPVAVPEPTTLVLLGIGLVGLGFSRTKPQRRSKS